MANASRFFRSFRLPAARPVPRPGRRLGVLPLEDRSTPSVSIPNSGFVWTSYGPAPITASTAPGNEGGTVAPGNLSTGGRVVQVATSTERIPTGEYGFNGRQSADGTGELIAAGDYGFGGSRNVFFAATPGGGVARGVEAPPNRLVAPSATNVVTVLWSFTTDRIAAGVNSETERSLKFGSVAVAPRNPDIVYAGGGDLGYGSAVYAGADRVSLDSYAGRGLYKSVDAGRTWTRIEGPQVLTPFGGITVGAFDRAAVSKIVFDPTDPTSNTVFVVVNASTSFSGVPSRNLPVAPAYVPGLANYGNGGYRPANGDEPVDGVLRENAVFRTKDGGQTWVNITQQLLLAAPVVDPGQGIPRTTIPFAPITDFTLDNQNPNVAYVAVADPNRFAPDRAFPFNGVYRTSAALADPDPTSGQPNIPYTVAFGGTSTQVPGSQLGSIRVQTAPSRPSTVYVTVAQFNSPLGGPLLSAFRSTDSGINFTQIILPASSQFIDDFGAYNQAVVIDPNNADRVYLAGRSLSRDVNFIQVTVDGGLTFQPVNTPATGAGPYRLVRTMSLDPQGRLVLATDGGVFRQTGTGFSAGWESLNGPVGSRLIDPDLVPDPDGPGPLTGSDGPLLPVYTGGLAAVETLSVALPPTNADQFVSGTNTNGTVRFNDPGVPGGPVPDNRTLQAQPAVDLTRIGGSTVYDFLNPQTVYHAGTQLLTNGQGSTFGGPDPARVVVRSTNGGVTWEPFGQGITNPGAAVENGLYPLVIDPADSTRLFFGTDFLNIYESGRWGNTLRGQTIPNLPFVTGASGPFAPVAISSIGVGRFDDRVVYVAVQQRVDPLGPPNSIYGPALYRINTNFNVSPEPRWRDVSPDIVNRGAGSPLPGYLMPLDGAGAPNPNLPQDNLLTGTITDIEVDPFDSNVVLITVDTPAQAGRVWRTTNGGGTWTDISGSLPGARQANRADEALRPYTVVLDPNRLAGASDDDVYVGTSTGVYRLRNPEVLIPNPNNPTGPPIFNTYQWEKVGAESLPDVQVRDLALNTTTGLLAAATYGRGVFQFQIRPLITGFTFDDVDGNGVQDPGETPLPNLPVIAFNLATGAEQANTLTRSAGGATQAVGFYEFRSLPGSPDQPGQYRIQLGNPAGQFLTTPERRYDASTLGGTGGVVQTTTVQAGANEPRRTLSGQTVIAGLPGADLGVFGNATIQGAIFDDLNGDGVRQIANEPGRGGLLVELIDPRTGARAIDPRTGQPIAPATTDSNGVYRFTELVPLQTRRLDANNQPILPFDVFPYGVRLVSLPGGTVQTNPTVTSTNEPVPVRVFSNRTSLQDVGVFTLNTLTGVVFDDTNGDGVRQGEPRLGGVQVRLFQFGRDGVQGTADDGPTLTQPTNPDGEYTFANLGPGTYLLQQVGGSLPPGYRPTTGAVGADGLTTSIGPLTPTSGQTTFPPLDFGNFRDAGLAGFVFEDDNGDGRRQPSETRPVVGATVVLLDPGADGQTGTPALDADNVVLATTVSGADGSYQFTGRQPLVQGNGRPYVTRVTEPNSLFVQTSADGRVLLSSGIVTGGQNLGFFRRTTISGFAFEDVNGNGVQDAGEPAAVNFPVSLLNSNNPAEVVGTATTDSTGQYRFAFDPANPGGFSGGPLQVNETEQGPGGAVIAYRIAVNLPNVIQTNAPGDLVLTSGVPAGGPVLALFRTVGFGGTIFDDTDGDGARDAGEPGVAGVTVELVTAGGTVAVNQATGQPITTTTAANGSYTLQAPNGTFTVRLAGLPGGTIQTTAAPAPQGTSSGLTLPAIDLGTFRTFNVAGVVYDDLNGSGSRDAGEPGLANLAVRLVTATGAPTAFTTTTDGAGNYTLAGVGPGRFQLAPVLPAGLFFTTPAGPVSFTSTSGLVLPQAGTPTSFGVFRGATVSGNVFEDLNRSGSPDSNEPGSAGFTVEVLNGAGAVLARGTSDAAGNYSIGSVPAGATSVRLAPRPGFLLTLSPVPLGGAVGSGAATAAGRLGAVRLGSVSGRVFNDANRSGRPENAETGLAGAVVELVQNTTVVATATTDAAGNFTILGVAGGSYTLRLAGGSVPAGRVQTGPQSSNLVYPLTVTEGTGTAGNARAGLDFGVAGRKRYAVAADGGGGPRVQVYDAVSGALVSDQFVYEQTFTGGVRVASGDVNGDGVDDLVTVAGKGGGPRVRALDGVTGATLYDYFAYEPTFRDGLYVAAADVNGDGFADIITGTDTGGGPRVTVFSGRDGSQVLDFFAFDSDFRGGVRIGAGDVDGDGRAEVIAASGPGLGAEVRVFNSAGQRINTFAPVDPSFTGGLYVAGGASDPFTGRASVLVGTGAGYADQGFAFVFDGLSGEQVFALEAFPQGPDDTTMFTGDVRVAAFDTTGDSVPEIAIASGAGSRSRVRFLDGNNRQEVANIFPFEAAFLGGLFIG